MNQVYWMLNMQVLAGQSDALEPLMKDMVANTQKTEPNTLNYEWFLSADKKELHIYERYTDSDAALAHLATFGERFAERFMAVLAPLRVVFYGNASPELREAVAGFGAIEMKHIGGVTR